MTDPEHADLKPTRELTEEHKTISPVVAAMEREAEHIRAARSVDGRRVHEMVEFTRGFTDGCHHRKEEEVLFPVLLERTDQSRSLVEAMLKEHDGGRQRITAIETALPAAIAGDPAALDLIARELSNYASLLTSHIAKEQHLVWPLTDRVLSEDEQRHIGEEFERIERETTGAGGHQAFVDLAARITRDTADLPDLPLTTACDEAAGVDEAVPHPAPD
jgi:hemerythrin-like domain-containing protein